MPALVEGSVGSRAPRRDWTTLITLVGFAVLAFVYLGLRLLIEPGSHFLGYGTDPKTFIWCFGWWPFAILHGLNPFVSSALWAPSGVNLAWTASIPGLALLFSPLTLLVGPVDSFNIAAVLVPALDAWAAFLLCRRLTRSIWPSLVGGYLYGFSSYVLAQDEGHPHITAVFVVPLVALVIVHFLEGEVGGRGLVLRLGLLFAFELLISTEVTFTLGLAIVIGLVLGFVLVPERRRAIAALVPPLAGAAVFAAALDAPFVYYALTGFQSAAFHNPSTYVTDLLNFAVPTKIALSSLGWAASIADRFPGNNAERDAYLGIPTVLIIALYAVRRARAASARFLLASLAVAVVCSLGSELTIDGHRIVWMPWSIVGGWSLFDNVLPERLALYVDLLAAVIVALWMAAQRSGPLRWLLPALAVLALIPNPDAGVWATRLVVPRFFTASTYRGCLRRNEIVLALPVSSDSDTMLWQAESGYRFRMAGGDIAPSPPASFLTSPGVTRVAEGAPLRAGQTDELKLYLRSKDVTTVVVDPRELSRWSGALDRIATPQAVGGIILYRVSRSSPACPAS